MTATLVTGVPGWLGTRLVRVLAGGLSDFPELTRSPSRSFIRCLALPGEGEGIPDTLPGPVEMFPGDLRDPDSLGRYVSGCAGGTLFHCAGIIHPSRVREFHAVNVTGTRNLLAAAEREGVRRAVVVSSNSPLGVNPHRDHRFDERSPYNPYMGYGRSKMLMEQVAGEFMDRGSLEVVIVRPPWFYGPDQPPRQSLFFSMIRKGTVPVVGDGENRRSMAYVDNICQGLLLSESSPGAAGETFWIADREPYTMNQIIDTVERLMEEEFGLPVAHRRLRLPWITGEIATFLDRAIQATGLYHQKIHVLSEMNKTIACSVDKAMRILGYEPRISLEEGMRRSLQWCLDQGIDI